MYEIVNESNLTILFDMDTQLSLFGAFGIYIKQGNHFAQLSLIPVIGGGYIEVIMSLST